VRNHAAERRTHLVWVALCFGAVLLLHFLTTTEGHWAHSLHVLFRKFYFLPILMSALWFGMRGALLAAAASVSSYTLHIWLSWGPDPFERIDQVGEMVSFVVLAVVAGALVTGERRAQLRAERTRRTAERHKIGTAVAALAETLGARDPETLAHSRRVAHLAQQFATFLGRGRREAHSLYLAGIVHDIGKIGVRDDVLLKPDTLTPAEREMIMQHPKIAEQILAPVGFQQVVRYAAVHHENMDGSGYPEGLKGKEIPVPGRILAIADTYDALRAERPYKPSQTDAQVREMLQTLAGTKLDTALLQEFWAFLDARPAAASDTAAPGPAANAGTSPDGAAP
jgi:putative nucleotidyltransferase with HDIG domain